MTDKAFDIAAARAELDTLRRRARALEGEIAAALERQLTDALTGASKARGTAELLADVRAFVDER